MSQESAQMGCIDRAAARVSAATAVLDATPEARVRAVLERAGLQVTQLHVFPERPYRWSVRVLAEVNTEATIRDLKVVDVIRYWRLPGLAGEPDEFVVTVDHLSPDAALSMR